ncbi:uncharacterized protein ACNS7B_000314 isoform 1-T1 [Menidia menidia]
MPGRRSLHPDEPNGGLPADVQQMFVVKEEDPWIPSLDQQDPEGLNIKEEEDQLWTSPEEKQFHGQETDIRKFSGLPADVQQVLVVKEEYPWNPSLDQQDPEGLNIKEEEDQLWTSPEEKQFHGQETDIRKFSGSTVTVKIENEEEKPELSQLYQIKTEGNRESEPPSSSSAEQMKAEADGEDCGGPEAARNPDLNDPLASNTDEQTSDSSETEVSDEDYWGKSSDTLPETVDGNRNWKPTPVSDSGVTHDKDFNTAGKPYSCSECGKQFSCKLSFHNHSKVHTVEKPFDCHDCGKRFNTKCNLQSHMRVHTGEKPFVCTSCGKTFSINARLKKHIRRSHTGEKPFACNDCGKRFGDRAALGRHTRVHTGEKPFSCTSCSKTFPQRSALETHIRIIHEGKKPFTCDDCGKMFSVRGRLITHRRVHTGEKPFACSLCSKRFSEKTKLTRHLRVHTGEKRFSCNDCGKGFIEKYALTQHLRVHTGEKPFSCNDCGKGYRDKKSLKVHTGEKPLSCNDVSKRFSDRSDLNKHMKVDSEPKPNLNSINPCVVFRSVGPVFIFYQK